MHGSTTLRLHKLSRNLVVRKVKTKELIKSPNSLQLDLNKHSIFIVICMEVSYIDMTVTANLQPESPPNCKHCLLTPFLLPTHTSILRSTPEGSLLRPKVDLKPQHMRFITDTVPVLRGKCCEQSKDCAHNSTHHVRTHEETFCTFMVSETKRSCSVSSS